MRLSARDLVVMHDTLWDSLGEGVDEGVDWSYSKEARQQTYKRFSEALAALGVSVTIHDEAAHPYRDPAKAVDAHQRTVKKYLERP